MKSLVGRNILFSSSDDGNDTRISRDIGMAAYARSSLCPQAILSEKIIGMDRPIRELTTIWCLFKRK
ncbi:Dihomomethionine N-hydroxylase [Fusarium oxysporum f. sp. albedinis]|nr:Dihomomethionine N-hydroxylase [Fusarium oxysporum f. sp. albedinis]